MMLTFFRKVLPDLKEMEESEGHWETLREHEDYEIWTEFPNQIRKKINKRIIKECTGRGGYIVCHLNSKQYRKHRLIAEQFLPNPDQLPQVDHINHVRSDNHLSNLRWVSASDNGFNKSAGRLHKFEYFDELPAPCQAFVFYNGYDFEGYMIDQEKNMFFHNGLMFRKLRQSTLHGRYQYYHMFDIDGIERNVYLNKID
jgi:hypothetical protein